MGGQTTKKPYRLRERRFGADVGSGGHGTPRDRFEPTEFQEERRRKEEERAALEEELADLELRRKIKKAKEALAPEKPKEPKEPSPSEIRERTRFRQQQGKRQAKRLTQTSELEAALPEAPMGLLQRAGLGLETFSAEEVDPLHSRMEDFRKAQADRVSAQQTQQENFAFAKSKSIKDTEERMSRDGWYRNETGAWIGPSGEPTSDQVYEQAYNRELERRQGLMPIRGGGTKTLLDVIQEQKAAEEQAAEAEAAAAEAAQEQAQVMRFMNEPAAPAPAPAAEPPAGPQLTPEDIAEISRLLQSPYTPEEDKEKLRRALAGDLSGIQ